MNELPIESKERVLKRLSARLTDFEVAKLAPVLKMRKLARDSEDAELETAARIKLGEIISDVAGRLGLEALTYSETWKVNAEETADYASAARWLLKAARFGFRLGEDQELFCRTLGIPTA